MTGPLNLDTAQILNSGSLKDGGGEYKVVFLSENHIGAILDLQETAISALKDEEKTFLLRKDRAFFEKLLPEGGAVIGIVHEGELIAQSIIVNPTQDNPKSGMTDMALNAKPEEISVLQGVIVLPDFRGNDLMKVMVDEWLANSHMAGRNHVVAEVSAGNPRSWSVFLKEGLRLDSIGHDPGDGETLFNMHAHTGPLIQRRMKGDFARAAKKGLHVPANDVRQQQSLLAKGWKGVGYDKTGKALVFRRAGPLARCA